MILKNHKENLSEISDKAKNFPIIEAVILDRQKGNIYSFSGTGYEAQFILHRANFGYLDIEGDTQAGFKDFLTWIRKEASVPAYFHLYEMQDSWPEAVESTEIKFKVRNRVQLRIGNPAGVPQSKLAEGYSIRSLQKKDEPELSMQKMDSYKNFWESYDAFIADGYGTGVLSPNNEIVSICYSAAVGKNSSEIDIITVSEEQGKGLGLEVTIAYIQESLRKDIIPNWDCFSENQASLRVALKAGFKIRKNYQLLSLYDSEK